MTYFYRRKNDFGDGYIDTYAYFSPWLFKVFFKNFSDSYKKVYTV